MRLDQYIILISLRCIIVLSFVAAVQDTIVWQSALFVIIGCLAWQVADSFYGK